MRWTVAAPIALILAGLFLLPLGAAGSAAPSAPRAQLGTMHPAGALLAAYLTPTSITSTNWGGYAVTGSTGTVTKVTGAWVQPAVKCTGTTSLAAFWVGIDGFGTNSVEQTGTIAECIAGTAYYYVWWEMFPTNAVQIYSTSSISAGDHFTASVVYHAKTSVYTMAITDKNTSTLYETNSTQTASRGSAECVAEAPSGSGGLYPLSNFGKMAFSSCTATISGSSHAIGAFSSVYKITMVDSAMKIKASVSALTKNTSFSVTWKRAT